jgi:hypothetical protein
MCCFFFPQLKYIQRLSLSKSCMMHFSTYRCPHVRSYNKDFSIRKILIHTKKQLNLDCICRLLHKNNTHVTNGLSP